MIDIPAYSLSKPLITEGMIQERIQDLAGLIQKKYPDPKNLLFIGVLKGSFVFLSDLIRSLPCPLSLDFIQASSYGSRTKSNQKVEILKEPTQDIEGKDVILVEDIIDSGYTIQKIIHYMAEKKPNSLFLCTLLDKPSRREIEVPIDFVGFTVPDLFVVGYGLDVNEKFRNLPYIAEAVPSH